MLRFLDDGLRRAKLPRLDQDLREIHQRVRLLDPRVGRAEHVDRLARELLRCHGKPISADYGYSYAIVDAVGDLE